MIPRIFFSSVFIRSKHQSFFPIEKLFYYIYQIGLFPNVLAGRITFILKGIYLFIDYMYCEIYRNEVQILYPHLFFYHNLLDLQSKCSYNSFNLRCFYKPMPKCKLLKMTQLASLKLNAIIHFCCT